RGGGKAPDLLRQKGDAFLCLGRRRRAGENALEGGGDERRRVRTALRRQGAGQGPRLDQDQLAVRQGERLLWDDGLPAPVALQHARPVEQGREDHLLLGRVPEVDRP